MQVWQYKTAFIIMSIEGPHKYSKTCASVCLCTCAPKCLENGDFAVLVSYALSGSCSEEL